MSRLWPWFRRIGGRHGRTLRRPSSSAGRQSPEDETNRERCPTAGACCCPEALARWLRLRRDPMAVLMLRATLMLKRGLGDVS
jgi:hypothetical protein